MMQNHGPALVALKRRWPVTPQTQQTALPLGFADSVVSVTPLFRDRRALHSTAGSGAAVAVCGLSVSIFVKSVWARPVSVSLSQLNLSS